MYKFSINGNHKEMETPHGKEKFVFVGKKIRGVIKQGEILFYNSPHYRETGITTIILKEAVKTETPVLVDDVKTANSLKEKHEYDKIFSYKEFLELKKKNILKSGERVLIDLSLTLDKMGKFLRLKGETEFVGAIGIEDEQINERG